MNAAIISPRFEETNATLPARKSPFNIFLTYADFDTALRGRRVYEQLVNALGHEFSFGLRLWKFDVLEISRLRALATAEAKDADLLIVSAHGNLDIPITVKVCLESGLNQARLANAAVIALIDNKSMSLDRNSSVHTWLRDLAAQYHADYAEHVDDGRPENQTPSGLELAPLEHFWRVRRQAHRTAEIGVGQPIGLAPGPSLRPESIPLVPVSR